MKIGAQLYTVRDFCKDTDSLFETLKKIADIGYKYIQVSGVCEYDAAWLKNALEQTGLKCVLTHIPAEKLINETDKAINEHNIFDCRYIGLGYFDFAKENAFAEFINEFSSPAKKLSENNKHFMYHNHSSEFIKLEGKTILEHLAEHFPPNEMGFTFDTYWAQHAGADPAEFLKLLANRIPCIHLKDHKYNGDMAVIGEGNINFDRVFAAAKAGNTEYMLVEQDDCYGENPFECLKRSYKNLKSLGFE